MALAFEAGLQKPPVSGAIHIQPNRETAPASVDPLVLSSSAIVTNAQKAKGLKTINDFSIPSSKTHALAVVHLTRSKQESRHLVALASAVAETVVVDGQKTDGIESIHKAVKVRVPLGGLISKAHGKLFWFSGGDFSDWASAPTLKDGFQTVPGIFSEDGPDSGSLSLLHDLPDDVSGQVLDLGAGWGFLSSGVLKKGASHITLVEDDSRALECARHNLGGAPADFVWADATAHQGAYDVVISNPPFHQGRKGTPDLGKAFIESAARCLKSRGTFWMVANRHLPYEDTLKACFADVQELDGTAKFKTFRANGPVRSQRELRRQR